MAGTQSKYSVPNLERALDIFELLSVRREGLLVAHIARELDIPRNSVFRICSTLLEKGYLKYFKGTQRVVMSRRLFGVAYRAMGDDDVRYHARSAMLDLRNRLKETIVLGTLMETDGAVLEEMPGLHHMNFRIERGARFHLHCAAPGKAMMAYLDDSERESLLEKIDYVLFNERTIKNAIKLREELHKVQNLI